MDNHKSFERRYRRYSWGMRAFFFVGIALLGSDWGLRVWLIGIGLIVGSTLWGTITEVLLDRLDELETQIRSRH